jgi:hypothetical protein
MLGPITMCGFCAESMVGFHHNQGHGDQQPEPHGRVVGRTNTDIKHAQTSRVCCRIGITADGRHAWPWMTTSRAAMTTSASYRIGDVEDSGSVVDHARSVSVARCTQEANFSDSSRSAT